MNINPPRSRRLCTQPFNVTFSFNKSSVTKPQYVIVQIVFNPDFSQEALNIAETVRSEYIVEVQGVVIKNNLHNAFSIS
jgi:hypothetical protein